MCVCVYLLVYACTHGAGLPVSHVEAWWDGHRPTQVDRRVLSMENCGLPGRVTEIVVLIVGSMKSCCCRVTVLTEEIDLVTVCRKDCKNPNLEIGRFN